MGVYALNPIANGTDNKKCVPSSCGIIHNISYPFRLKHDPKHCGVSSFTLECDNNVTMLRLSSGKYYVKEINYRDGNIRVVDPGIEKNNCATLPRFPLDESIYRSYGTSSSTPLAFLKCANQVHSSSYVSTASCLKSEAYGYVKRGTTTVSELEDGCSIESTTLITTSATMKRNMSYEDIHKELLYGFDLEYDVTYVWVNCRERKQWSYPEDRCFPHSLTGFFQLLWAYIYDFVLLELNICKNLY
ncbi:uncharacterized protein LOC126803470 [Argentina anserina]|uniref:uncharacterized protein LOC126803470 n=1 Tax=Argentina anserina TaxID=57926 RepID=UPI002176939E|nr:uncharacterized protein LOC126803470 [Potentilla anserina]